jgi:hypothetical protein
MRPIFSVRPKRRWIGAAVEARGGVAVSNRCRDILPRTGGQFLLLASLGTDDRHSITPRLGNPDFILFVDGHAVIRPGAERKEYANGFAGSLFAPA